MTEFKVKHLHERAYILSYWSKGETRFHEFTAPSLNMAIMQAEQWLAKIAPEALQFSDWGVEVKE